MSSSLRDLRAQLAAAPSIVHASAPAGLDVRIRAKLAEVRALLTRNVEGAREVLQALVAEPFRWTPEIDERHRRYRFSGVLELDRLVSGIVDLPMCFPRQG